MEADGGLFAGWSGEVGEGGVVAGVCADDVCGDVFVGGVLYDFVGGRVRGAAVGEAPVAFVVVAVFCDGVVCVGGDGAADASAGAFARVLLGAVGGVCAGDGGVVFGEEEEMWGWVVE